MARHNGAPWAAQEEWEDTICELSELRSLLFDDLFGFLRRHSVFSIRAGNISEWHGLRDRTELPKRALSSLVGIGVESSTHERAFARHLRIRSMLRMVCHLQWGDLTRLR